MPTYTVHSPAGTLDQGQKQQLARDITLAHNGVTGAQTFFAQVMFLDRPQGDWFVGGQPLEGPQVFVHGQIRAGRSGEVKLELLRRLVDVTAEVSGLPRNRVWVYLVDLPAEQMAEYGHVLPLPGTEASWLANLPQEDRDWMESIGAAR